MQFLRPGTETEKLEKQCKNKWRWDWMNENDSSGNKFDSWLKKPNIPGVCFCSVCGKTIKYQSSGKKAVKNHAKDKTHQRNLETVKTNQVLPGSSKAVDSRIESMQDRIARQRILTTAFVSEHCLPFSLAGHILDLAKRLAEDKVALGKTTLSRTSTAYVNTHGLAKSFKEELKAKVKDSFVSLNIDEATNRNMDKVLNIIVQYYDEESNKVVLDHLGSRVQNVATAAEIVKSIESVLLDYEIKWTQVVSVLMDNCSTMRGVKGGVETLIREKNGCLLDVSGDTVHMISNVAKTLMKNVDGGLQSICSDLYYDVEESPKVKEIVNKMMTLMNAEKSKHLIRPISSRFLQMYDVTSRLVEVFDYLTVYYAAFLTDEERLNYSWLFEQIYRKHEVSEEAQAAITLLQMAQDKQQKSVTSHDRKDRILDALFTKRIETITLLNLFRGLLSVFQGYVKKFQAEVPQIHILHEQMVDITKTFLAMFIKPEHIPDNVSALVKLDVSDRSIQKTDRDLAVGIYAQSLITKARMDKAQRHWLELLFMNLRTGYVSAATKILQLPMKNKTIRCLSALDPELHGHSQVSAAFRYLANLLPNVVSGDEEGSLAMELNNYNVDRQVKAICEDFDDGKRVDLGFWSKVAHLKTFDNQRYPVLSKLVFAMLTIFSGPLVEGTFNVMGDIIEEDRTRMNIENYEAVAIVKTALKRKAVKASALKVTPSMKRCCIHAYSSYKQHIKLKKQMQEERKQEQLNESISKLKQEKAKRFAKLLKLRQRTLQRKSVAKKKTTENK